MNKIKEFTKHSQVRLLPAGDSAIFTSYYISKKVNRKAFILIPDQGGWMNYERYAKILGFEVIKIKTNRGKIDLEDLEEHCEKGAAFIYSNPGAYIVDQPIKEIWDICKDKCVVVMDVTGCIGDKDLCNGGYADLLLGSFGKWKPVNNEYGGFISFRQKVLLNHARETFPMFKTNFDHGKLMGKLNNVKKRLAFFYNKCLKIKEDLKDFDVVHPDGIGINVIVGFKTEGEKKSILKYCEEKNLEYTMCPRYIRVEEDAVSIEVKRLE